MIVRLWLATAVLLPVLAWVLMVPLSPAPHQGAPGGNIAEYRAQGLLPKPGAFTLSREIGHEVFEIPAEDTLHRGEEAALEGMDMPGMAMGEPKEPEHAEEPMPGMAMGEPKEAEHAEAPMPGMAMGEPKEAEHAEEPMPGMAMGEPKEAEHAEAPMPGMAMGEPKEAEHAEAPMPGMAMGEPKEAEHAEEPMPGMAMGEPKEPEHAEAPMPGMAMGEPKEPGHAEEPMPGMAMGEPKEAEHAEAPMPGMAMEKHEEPEHGEMAMGEMEAGGHGGGGLMAMPAKMAGMASRTIEIEMKEWGFSPPSITVKAGEVIHFKVRNAGRLPHEFMFMPQAGMNAVNYRLERADWNLTEHEASFERAVVLPGDGFETVIKVEQPGVYMFMCMFPYHMQFGMMGMMMTEGASMEGMDMGGHGDMKM